MNLSKCKVIHGKSFNVQENASEPLKVLTANFETLQELYHEVIAGEVERVCFVGSSCMYPMRDEPLKEEMLGTGSVYEGNALYSYIKLLGWQICSAASKQVFMVIPSEIFGQRTSTHFVTQIMQKMHRAKEEGLSKVTFWGSGTVIRHPLFVEDYIKILNNLADHYKGTDPINIAPPITDAKSICRIVLDIQDVVGFKGDVEWDTSYPDGQKIKILDNSRLMKWDPEIKFTPWKEALSIAYETKSYVCHSLT